MKKLIFFCLPFLLNSQNVSIGNWSNYLAYNSASNVVEAENKIYCVANKSLFYVDKYSKLVTRMSKINGLSDVNVSKISYSEKNKTLIVIYENCNIDLITTDEIYNISDIKRKEIIGEKKINNVSVIENSAYLSCSFGLVLLDLIKKEIGDTYRIGTNGFFNKINGCAVKQDTIFAATSNGIYFADINSSALFDYNNWNVYKSSSGVYYDVICSEHKLLIDSSSFINSIGFYNNLFFSVYDTIIYVYNDFLELEYTITPPELNNIKDCYYSIDAHVWIADSVGGLIKLIGEEGYETFMPEGPISNDIYSLKYLEENLYVCHGGHYNFGLNYLNKTGVSIMQQNYYWKNEDYYRLGWAWDIVSVAVLNGKEYYASWYDGIPVLNGDILEDRWRWLKEYGYDNTNGVLDTSYSANNRIRISDLKVDKSGNLWGLNSEVNNPLFVKTINDEWYSFSMNQGVTDLFFDELLIDYIGQKWGVIGRGGGVFVYNDNGTLSDPLDDSYNILTTNIGDGGLPSKQVYTIEEDLNNAIWVGTDQGVCVFYSPEMVFSGGNYDAQQILIQDGDYGQYLLSEEKVTAIAVDGANRKWIGTEKSGVFLFSEDGYEKVLHFTEDNSPIFSNTIIDITINNSSGEVFFGTSKGLLSYRSDATTGSATQLETHVFPNPVRENYTGFVAIKNLVNNVNVKITDVHGNLVFETYSKGGQATWNGKNKNNERVPTGIYLVYTSDINGIEKIVSKILFIE